MVAALLKGQRLCYGTLPSVLKADLLLTPMGTIQQSQLVWLEKHSASGAE